MARSPENPGWQRLLKDVLYPEAASHEPSDEMRARAKYLPDPNTSPPTPPLEPGENPRDINYDTDLDS